MSNQNQNQPSQAGQSTFVATIRTDLRMIASIAKLMENDGSFVGTTGKVASEAIRILSSMSQKVFPVKTYEEAVMELRRMGYNDPMAKGTKHYTAIQKKLGFELNTQEATDEMMPVVEKYRKQLESQKNIVSAEERARAEKVMNIREEEPEPAPRERKPEKATKKKPLRIAQHTKEDEQADLKQQKDAFAGPSPLAAEEEAVIENGKSSQKKNVDKPNQSNQPA